MLSYLRMEFYNYRKVIPKPEFINLNCQFIHGHCQVEQENVFRIHIECLSKMPLVFVSCHDEWLKYIGNITHAYACQTVTNLPPPTPHDEIRISFKIHQNELMFSWISSSVDTLIQCSCYFGYFSVEERRRQNAHCFQPFVRAIMWADWVVNLESQKSPRTNQSQSFDW